MNIDKSRIYGDITELDYSKIESFFDSRKSKVGHLKPINLTMYQDKNPQIAVQRDNFEKQRLFELLNIENKKFKILDIGCGIGRWGFHLSDFADLYLGFDYSDTFINLAKEKAEKENLKQLHFQILSAITFNFDDLIIKPPFNLIIIAGVLAYLNDSDCVGLLNKVGNLMSDDSVFYLREPVGIDTRLTLDSFYSEDMNFEYSAIYRTIDEYDAIFQQSNLNNSTKLIENVDLFQDNLNNRKETKQHIFIFKKTQI